MRGDGTRKPAKTKRSASNRDRDGARQSAFAAIEDKHYTLTLNGVAKNLNAEEALQQKTFQQALKQSVRAIRIVYGWIDEREAMLTPVIQRWPLFIIENPDPAGVDEALVLLGLATRVPHHPREDGSLGVLLALEPVNRAIVRRDKPLSAAELWEIRNQVDHSEGVAASAAERP